MISAVVREALRGLVAGRCYPNTFPQAPAVPVWPSIRYSVISQQPVADICGTGDVSTDDTRIQVDIVAKTYGAAITLRDQVITAMVGLDPPAARDGGFEDYDAETETHRCTLDFIFCASSS